jgi:hypothetical protein
VDVANEIILNAGFLFSKVPRAKQANVNLIKSVKITFVDYQVYCIVLMEYANVGKP